MVGILITGGTGLIGRQLTKVLLQKGYKVHILSRSPKKENEFKWDNTTEYIDTRAFENIQYIIHLAGAGIAEKRWTKRRKQLLIDSRVKTTNLLFKKIKEHDIPLQGFISASGIGYYGAINSNTIFKETDAPHNDFLATVCVLWEQAAKQFEKLKIPVTIVRTGIVLSNNGGALDKMKTLIISPLGNGRQYMPWIHIDDLCQLYLNAIISENYKGVFNAVAPEYVNNFYFSKKLAAYFYKSFLPIGIPSIVLQLIFGKMSKIMLKGSRVSAKKLQENKFIFTFTTLNNALKNLTNT